MDKIVIDKTVADIILAIYDESNDEMEAALDVSSIVLEVFSVLLYGSDEKRSSFSDVIINLIKKATSEALNDK